MPLQITGRHVDISNSQREYIEKKVRRFRKIFAKIDEISFTLILEKREYTVEATFRAGPIHAVTKSSASSALAAIDKAVDRLESQALKIKDKRFGNKKHVGRSAPATTEEAV